MDNDEYKHYSALEHVKLRPDMYIGSISQQQAKLYILRDGKFVLEELSYSPACLKIIDEICVNAVDRYTKNPNLVKKIKINFNEKNGLISVRNDGPAISLEIVDTLEGPKYNPEASFTLFLSGRNFSNEKRVVGGMNGIGAKAANAFSKIFQIDARCNNRRYTQKFRDRLTVIDPPEIREEQGHDFTQISFLPKYSALGYLGYTPEVYATLNKLIEMRAYQMAAFVNCEVRYNGLLIVLENFAKFCKMFLDDGEPEPLTTKLKNPENPNLDLDVCIGLSDGKFKNMSIINGINVYMGGSHISYIKDLITTNLNKPVTKILSSCKLDKSNNKRYIANLISNHLFIFVKGYIENPEFNSQSKDFLSTPIDKFKNYQFSAQDYQKIWQMIEPRVTESIFGKTASNVKKTVTRSTIILDKGEDAQWAGNKRRALDCTLIICEGDSALGMMTRGINHNKTPLKKEYYGTFSIQGVPINARRECRVVTSKGQDRKVRSDKLTKNKRFAELVQLLGLDYEKTYGLDDEGNREFSTLRYGRVVVAVDQDEDGKGQIFGLIVNFITYFWPALILRGFVKRFNTPIIRAYPVAHGGLVKEFYTLNSFRSWVAELGGDDMAAKKYKINYYKGLASHDVREIPPMFNKFETRLYTYALDEQAEQTLEIYYGKETADRKLTLSSPVAENLEEKYLESGENIPISVLMHTDVKEFQRDNIMRKLPHAIDGMVPARRKAFHTARLVFNSKTKEIKVCNFTGMVINDTNYHHGDASLAETIIKMAQRFVGARNLPLLIGVGEFGSRRMGGKDHGQPRYVYVKLNKKLSDALYPPTDDFLLSYHFDEGKRCEPRYYVPILPTAILENMSIPATGWKAEIWARDYKTVLSNVRAMVRGEIPKCGPLHQIWLRGNSSEIRYGSDGGIYIFGKYTYDEKSRVLTITELPPGISNESYKNSVAYIVQNSKKELRPEFKRVNDSSNYDEETNIDQICIEFELNKGVMDGWRSNDSEGICSNIEYQLNLYVKANSHLNMIVADDSVHHFQTYQAVVNRWFQERKKLYIERISRLTQLTRLRILYYDNIIRFTIQRDSYNITNHTTEAEFIDILSGDKYVKFNKSLLFSPSYTSIDELEARILRSDQSSYEYLISLNFRQLLASAHESRIKTLADEKKMLEALEQDSQESDGKFKGQQTWLHELEALEKIIDEALNLGWDYTKNKPRFE